MLNAIRCKTKVLQLGTGWDHASGIMYPCIDPFFITAADSNANSTDSAWMEQALDIAGDSAQYPGYAEVGEWMDEYNLYSQLDADSLLLNSNPDLLYFYTESQAGLIDEIKAAEEAIKVLCSPDTDSSNFADRLLAATAANNAIANGETWEMNELEVNRLYLKLIAGQTDTLGFDTLYTDSLLMITLAQAELLTQGEQAYLHDLAYSCPFAEGYAVYKARALWSIYKPDAKFDDRLLCINAQNKGGGAIEDIDTYIAEILNEKGTQHQAVELAKSQHKFVAGIPKGADIWIYPNPASDRATLTYLNSGDGHLILYDMLGKVVLECALPKSRKQVIIEIGQLPAGIYSYKCLFEDGTNHFGKLTINR